MKSEKKWNFWRNFWMVLAAVSVGMLLALVINSTRAPQKAFEVKKYISQKEDYALLAKLESDFCAICDGQTSQEWGETGDLGKIVKKRNAILDKYGLRGRHFLIFSRTNFRWECHYDTWDFQKRCEQ